MSDVQLSAEATRELKSLLLPIIRSAAPQEADTFAKLPPLTLLQAAKPRPNAGKLSYEFGGLIEAGSLAIHLVAGTLAVIDLVLRRRERQEEREFEYSIQREWKLALVEAGVSRELADEIPVKYSADFIKFIAKYRLGKAS